MCCRISFSLKPPENICTCSGLSSVDPNICSYSTSAADQQKCYNIHQENLINIELISSGCRRKVMCVCVCVCFNRNWCAFVVTKTVPPVDGGLVLHLSPSCHPLLQARPAPDFWSAETHLARRLRPQWSRSHDGSSSALCWWRFL